MDHDSINSSNHNSSSTRNITSFHNLYGFKNIFENNHNCAKIFFVELKPKIQFGNKFTIRLKFKKWNDDTFGAKSCVINENQFFTL